MTATRAISVQVAPEPLPPLPVHPPDLAGKVVAQVLAEAKSFNSLPDPNGGPFGVGPTATYSLVAELPQQVGFRYEDALAAARQRAASQGTSQAVYQARNGAFWVGSVRMAPKGLPMRLLEMPDKVRSLDFTSKTPVLRAIVGVSQYARFPAPPPPPS